MNILRASLFGVCFALLCAGAPAATAPAASLVVERAIHFQSPKGEVLVLDAGTYAVEPESTDQLHLIAAGGKSLSVPATVAKHAERIEQPRALLVAVGNDERHLVLLLPGGKRLEAIGSLSGIHSRGVARTAVISDVALQSAIQATPLVQTVAAAPMDPAPALATPVVIDVPLQKPVGVTPRLLLRGFVDLHTHPLSNVGFGGKLVFGGVDFDSLLPTDPNCNKMVRASNFPFVERYVHALGDDSSVHGGTNLLQSNPFAPNPDCRDNLRELILHHLQQDEHANDAPAGALGYPTFVNWPKWNDITHQQMWWEWIKRNYDNGLRVMVALAVNNKTIADTLVGPGDMATDDMSSADLQIDEITTFVARHDDFMQIAKSSSELYQIVSKGKLAVVLGVEVDHIGNLGARQTLLNIPATPATQAVTLSIPAGPEANEASVSNEIGRLYGKGVRYIFPIHVMDNAFGGAAFYEDVFDLSSLRESGQYMQLECDMLHEGMFHRYKNSNDIFHGGDLLDVASLEAIAGIKLGLSPGLFLGVPVPPQCSGPQPQSGPPGPGMRNAHGLTDLGKFALREMMRRGMLIDIDHMSQHSMDDAFDIAKSIAGYPLNSGHAGLRCLVLGPTCTERMLTPAQYKMIGDFHGMAGIGTSHAQPYEWKDMYTAVTQAMGGSAVAAFGTDANGLVVGIPPPALTRTMPVDTPAYKACMTGQDACNKYRSTADRQACALANAAIARDCAAQNPQVLGCVQNCAHVQLPIQYSADFPQSSFVADGTLLKTWDYNVDGVAHYGMLPDFLQAIRSLPDGANMIDNNLMYGADYFYETWRISEVQGAKMGP